MDGGTLAPVSRTTPAPSWPGTTGMGCWVAPVTRCQSEWQTPAAAIFTRTSPSRGPSRSRVSRRKGSWGAMRMAAVIFMGLAEQVGAAVGEEVQFLAPRVDLGGVQGGGEE